MHCGNCSAWAALLGVFIPSCACGVPGWERADPLLGALLLHGWGSLPCSLPPFPRSFFHSPRPAASILPAREEGVERVPGGLENWRGLKGNP